MQRTECQPLAPFGTGSARSSVWTSPSPSIARTVTVCSPATASSQRSDHWDQVSSETSAPSSASRQSPSSIRTWTAEIPRCCAQAVPPSITAPSASLCRSAKERGTSTREAILIGPRSDQPRVVQ